MNGGGSVTQVSSYIYVSTKKLSSNTIGEVWDLQWSSVDVGMAGVQVSYNIYKGNEGSLAQFVENTTNTNAQEVVTADDVGCFFYIKAIVQKNGENLFPIEIRSPDVYLKEAEVISTPGMPEIVDDVGNASYTNLLTPEEATVLWRAPLKGDGSVDTSTKYDIWLVTDPNYIDDPPVANRIVENYVEPLTDYINEGNKTVGFQYKLTGLTPNSIYYFKIKARKQFMTFVNGALVVEERYSEAAIKVIITPASGNIDRPIYPNQPPFGVKFNTDGSKSINTEDITLQLKNMWYEYFDEDELRWKYIEFPKEVAKYDDNFIGEITYKKIVTDVITTTIIDDIQFRKVSYDSGLTIDTGCEEITDGMSLTAIKEIMEKSNYKIKDKSMTPNDPDEDATKNYDGKKHNIDIKLENLKPNTLYLFWVRIVRKANGTMSELSDPVIIATLPKTTEEPPTPVVPSIKVVPSDIYADIVCDFQPSYKYSIKIGTEDNMSKAKISKDFSVSETEHLLSYRIDKLTPGTNYFIWIQASVSKNGSTKKSEWSDSLIFATIPAQPPMAPTGFGIKSTADAISSYTAAFEWVMEEPLEYILEFSDNEAYVDSISVEVKSVEEYMIDKLRANKRYYARLYSYDKDKKLKSQPSPTVIFKTLKSNDEFDTSIDEETGDSPDVYKEEFDPKDGILKVVISGSSADTMIRKLSTDKKDGLKIDLNEYKTKVKKTRLVLSRSAIKAINDYKEELSIYDGKIELVLRPGSISNLKETERFPDQSKIQYEFIVENVIDKSGLPPDAKIKMGPYNITIIATDGNRQFDVKKLSSPMKLNTYYDSSKWYTEGLTGVFWYNEETKSWDRIPVINRFENEKRQGVLSFDVKAPGEFFIADKEKENFEDISYHVYEEEIKKVFAKYTMKNISGNDFQPGENLKVADGVMFSLTVLGIDYGSDFMPLAYKAGLIDRDLVSTPDELMLESEALKMVCRIYEIKKGTRLKDENETTTFIEENFSDLTDNSGEKLTRGEMIALIERVLEICGEID
jgi:hypothetical protein